MHKTLIQITEEEFTKSAKTDAPEAPAAGGGAPSNLLTSVLLGAGGAGILGGLAGGFMTKRRKNADGEEEDSADYRKRIMRNAMMTGGLGAVAGAGGGAMLDGGLKLIKGYGETEAQGSPTLNKAESILGDARIALISGGLGNRFAKNRVNNDSKLADVFKNEANKGYLKTIAGKVKNFHGLDSKLGTISDSGKFAESFRDNWANKDFQKAVLADKSFDRRLLKQLGLTDPDTSLSGGVRNAWRSMLGKSPAPRGSQFSNGTFLNRADKVLGKMPGQGVSNAVWGKGSGKGGVKKWTAISALLPSLLGTLVDDVNR